MQYRKLGRTGLDVSLICLGTMTWGRRNTQDEAHAQIRMALDAGVNFIDCAEMYPSPVTPETFGRTEEILGSWLGANKAERATLVIATKVTGPNPSLKNVRDRTEAGTRLDRASVLAACDASLKRLQVDHIDLYQVHWPERSVNKFGQLGYRHDAQESPISIEETLGALEELVQAGKVRHIGISNETAWGVAEYLRLSAEKGLARIQSIQNPYSLLNRSFEVGLAEFAHRNDVGLLAYASLAGGALSGKYLNGRQPAGARMTEFWEYYPRYRNANGIRATERYVDLATRHGLDPATMAHAFVNARGFLTANIVGATSLEQLKVALDSVQVSLPQAVLDELDYVNKDIPYPCP